MKAEGFARKVFALLAVALFMAGCNTMQGLGKDVQKAGVAVEKAAKN